jgi:DNA-binding transcriptional ArsR family regulator
MTTTILERVDEAIAQSRDELDRLTAARQALLGTSERRGQITGRALPARTTPTPKRTAPARNGNQGTSAKVLHTLAHATGPMTASEIANQTRLGRASVSTTLSKLARAGTITKAERGYESKDPAAA